MIYSFSHGDDQDVLLRREYPSTIDAFCCVVGLFMCVLLIDVDLFPFDGTDHG